jgi:hypothetical protein
VHRSPNLEIWHLSHENYQSIWDVAKKGTLTGVPLSSVEKPAKCDLCVLGKQTKSPVLKKCEEGDGHRATKKLEKVLVDLSGPHAVKS